MPQIPYIFNQIVSFIPKDTFDRLTSKYKGNAYVKNFSCWNHLLTMIWAQLTSRRSLRDIETSLRAHSDKLFRMGIGKSVSRNNIAYANATREVAIYRELAQVMMLKASRIKIKDKLLLTIGEMFNLNGFFAIDSSTVTFDLSKYPWSIPQEECGGIKIHTMFDLMRSVPRMCMITGHEERDQAFMEYYPYEKECFYMLDRIYLKTPGLYKIHTSQAYFVTRMKNKILYKTIENIPVDGVHVLSDQVIEFTGKVSRQGYPETLRLIHYYSSEKNETLEFLTNNFVLDAATIALLYQYRWNIEMFFKWIKQHLRIKTFYGTSANAVVIQIYTAFITFCTLALAADAHDFDGTLYEFSNIMSVSLTEKKWLCDLLKSYECIEGNRTEPDYPSLFSI